jgi:four helix bundle protein
MESAKNTVRSFKDLIVWKKSMDMVEMVYRITQMLPPHERFGLVSQMRRAAVSVPSNIAEGYGRNSTGSYKQFLSISRGSLFELETQIDVCIRLEYFTRSDTKNIFDTLTEISKMLTSLISKIK